MFELVIEPDDVLGQPLEGEVLGLRREFGRHDLLERVDFALDLRGLQLIRCVHLQEDIEQVLVP